MSRYPRGKEPACQGGSTDCTGIILERGSQTCVPCSKAARRGVPVADPMLRALLTPKAPITPASGPLEPLLIFSDAHRPYHDERAWQLMLQVGRWLKPTHLVVNGDLADFYAVSSHSKDPRRVKSLDAELADVNKGLDELDALGATFKHLISGNHEDRLARYLQDRAPELFTMFELPKLFNLKGRGWLYTPYKDHTKVGKLHLTHDVGAAGRYASFKALDTYQHSISTGHTHRLCYVVEGNAVGEFKLSCSFGWLGDASKVDYMHRVSVLKNWTLGFGVGYIHRETGVAYLTPVPIIDYTCVVNGTYFSQAPV